MPRKVTELGIWLGTNKTSVNVGPTHDQLYGKQTKISVVSQKRRCLGKSEGSWKTLGVVSTWLSWYMDEP